VSPIELQHHTQAHFYLNEDSTIGAWLFDNNSKAIWDESFTVQAHLGTEGTLASSNVYLTLQSAPGSKQFFLAAPYDLVTALELGNTPSTVEVELIAKKLIDSTTEDPWFIRRSPPFTVELVEPFIDWMPNVSALTKIPFMPLSPTFGADMETSGTKVPSFETPPTVTLTVERFDEESQAFQPTLQTIIAATPNPDVLAYKTVTPLEEMGPYRYRYELEGSTQKGPFSITSPWHTFTIRFGWEYMGGGVLALLIFLQILSGKTATVKGQIAIQEPSFCSENVAPARMYHSDRLQTRCNQALGTEHAFSIKPIRHLFFWKRLRLTMLKGTASVGMIKGRHVLNTKKLQKGVPIDLAPRLYELSLSGTDIKIKINLNI